MIVCSSTGDGDPPDNAAKFWRKLKKRSLPEDYLAKCHYTVLGKETFSKLLEIFHVSPRSW